jgi:hypothetical protein
VSLTKEFERCCDEVAVRGYNGDSERTCACCGCMRDQECKKPKRLCTETCASDEIR